MDSTINDGIKRANAFFNAGYDARALSVIVNDVLAIDPEHEEGKLLEDKYRKSLNLKNR
jgi:hypothetical protein